MNTQGLFITWKCIIMNVALELFIFFLILFLALFIVLIQVTEFCGFAYGFLLLNQVVKQ